MPKRGDCSEIGYVQPMERLVYIELREQESDIGENAGNFVFVLENLPSHS